MLQVWELGHAAETSLRRKRRISFILHCKISDRENVGEFDMAILVGSTVSQP
jgi:hypothetical protein